MPSTPMTRRQAIQTALAAGSGLALSSFLEACQSDSSSAKVDSLSPTPRNQTLFIDQATFTVFDSFNPYIPNGSQYNAGFGQVCKEFLFYKNLVTGEVKPWLGKTWQYNADFTQLTVTLDPNAHWNDGQPFTAKDVQFSIELLMNNPALTGSSSYQPFVKQVTVSDDHTVVITLNQGDPRFHYNLICGVVGGMEVVPAHIWSNQDPGTFKANPPVRTGPYKLDRTMPDRFMYIWKKDPNYWNKAELDPAPEYVVYRTAPNSMDSELEQFKRGQVDVPSFDYAHAIALKNSGYSNIILETAFRDPYPRAFVINSDPSKGLLSEPKFHWAVSYLVDRKTLGHDVWQPATPPAQYLWADYPGNDKWSNKTIADQYPLTYDPAKAASLLDELGAKAGSNGKRSYQGKALQYEIMSSVQPGQPEYIMCQKLADELAKVGIDANVRYYSGATWINKFYFGQYDIANYYGGIVFDPGEIYHQFETRSTRPIGQDASTGYNYMRLQEPDFDAVAEKIDNANPDPSDPTSKALFDQGLEEFYKYLPMIPAFQTTYPQFFNTTFWTGWPTNDNLYQVPSNWWGQWLFIVGKLKPTGHA